MQLTQSYVRAESGGSSERLTIGDVLRRSASKWPDTPALQEIRSDGENGRSYTERTYGRFERVIPLAADVDADKVEATFKNGILTVTVPKNPQARDKAKRIEIRPQ